jgi:hypothetical protein
MPLPNLTVNPLYKSREDYSEGREEHLSTLSICRAKNSYAVTAMGRN